METSLCYWSLHFKQTYESFSSHDVFFLYKNFILSFTSGNSCMNVLLIVELSMLAVEKVKKIGRNQTTENRSRCMQRWLNDKLMFSDCGGSLFWPTLHSGHIGGGGPSEGQSVVLVCKHWHMELIQDIFRWLAVNRRQQSLLTFASIQ